jgi:hypothetical protein
MLRPTDDEIREMIDKCKKTVQLLNEIGEKGAAIIVACQITPMEWILGMQSREIKIWMEAMKDKVDEKKIEDILNEQE